jgi:uncharacterized protein (UPF0335 family)
VVAGDGVRILALRRAAEEEEGPRRALEEARRGLYDVLLVDEIGKDISGAGFDTKVIGRIMNIYEKECERPRITATVLPC